MKIIVKEGQTILDVALQEYGSIESLQDFLTDNGLDWNSDLREGQEVEINTAGRGNAMIREYFVANSISLNNGEEYIGPDYFLMQTGDSFGFQDNEVYNLNS